jgi:hypothetical protein
MLELLSSGEFLLYELVIPTGSRIPLVQGDGYGFVSGSGFDPDSMTFLSGARSNKRRKNIVFRY